MASKETYAAPPPSNTQLSPCLERRLIRIYFATVKLMFVNYKLKVIGSCALLEVIFVV